MLQGAAQPVLIKLNHAAEETFHGSFFRCHQIADFLVNVTVLSGRRRRSALAPKQEQTESRRPCKSKEQ